jgi:hypothetical protein
VFLVCGVVALVSLPLAPAIPRTFNFLLVAWLCVVLLLLLVHVAFLFMSPGSAPVPLTTVE